MRPQPLAGCRDVEACSRAVALRRIALRGARDPDGYSVVLASPGGEAARHIWSWIRGPGASCSGMAVSTRVAATIWLGVAGGSSVALTADWAARSSSPLAMWAFGLSCMCCVLAAFGALDLLVTFATRLLCRQPDPPIPVARAVHRRR